MQVGMAKGKLVEKAERLIVEAKYQLPFSVIEDELSEVIEKLETTISSEGGMTEIFEGIRKIKWYLAVDENNKERKIMGVKYQMVSDIYDVPDVEQDPSVWRVEEKISARDQIVENKAKTEVGHSVQSKLPKQVVTENKSKSETNVADDVEATNLDIFRESIQVLSIKDNKTEPTKKQIKEYQAIYKAVIGFEQYGRKMSEVTISEIISIVNDESNITENADKFKVEMEKKFVFIASLKDYLILPTLIKRQELSINLMRINDLKKGNVVSNETLEKIVAMESGIKEMSTLLNKRELEVTSIMDFKYLDKKYILDGFNVKSMVLYAVVVASLMMNIFFGVTMVVDKGGVKEMSATIVVPKTINS